MKGKINSINIKLIDLLAVAGLALWAIFLNRTMHMTGFYSDDAYMWSFFAEDSFADFVFPATAQRCRPVSWLFTWLELTAIRGNFERIIAVNIGLLILTAAILYFFAKELSKSFPVAFLSGMAFVASRFSYYNVSQLLGNMEALAILWMLLICILLFHFLHFGGDGRFYWAVGIYVLACFTHERYMVLLPMFYYAALVVKKKKAMYFAAPLIAFALVLAVRYKLLGTLMPAGTGRSQVAETATLAGVWDSAKMQIKYLLGMNPGEEHLCGIPWDAVTSPVKTMVLCGAAGLAVLTVLFLIRLVKNLNTGNSTWIGIRDLVFFAGFIIGCITASSVTIRVEMRWIYGSFAILLLLIAFLYGYITQKKKSLVALAAAVLVLCCFIGEDMYYRQYWPQIYLFNSNISELPETDGE